MQILLPCRSKHCSYYVLPTTDYCPNCGIRWPILPNHLERARDFYSWAIFLTPGVVGALFFAQTEGFLVILSGFVFGLIIIGGPLAKAAERILDQLYYSRIKQDDCLRHYRRLIETRVHSLRELLRTLEQSKKTAKSTSAKRFRKTLEDLANDYLNKRREIEISLVLNHVQYLLYQLATLDDQLELKDAWQDVTSLRQSLSNTIKGWETNHVGARSTPALDASLKKAKSILQKTGEVETKAKGVYTAIASKEITTTRRQNVRAGLPAPEKFEPTFAFNELFSSIDTLEKSFETFKIAA